MVAGSSRSSWVIAGFFLGATVLGPASLLAAAPDDSTTAAHTPGSDKYSQARSRKQEILKQVPRYAPDRVLVRFRPGTAASETSKAHRKAGGSKLREIPGIDVHVVNVPAGSVQQKIASYRKNPNVEYAEPDYYRVLIIPDEGNDPGPDAGGIVAGRDYFEEQWGLHNTGQQHTSSEVDPFTLEQKQVVGAPDADIDVPEGWDITAGDPAIKIAVLDTGIDCGSV